MNFFEKYEKQIKYSLIGIGVIFILIGLFVDFSWLKEIGDSFVEDGHCRQCEMMNHSLLIFVVTGLVMVLFVIYSKNLQIDIKWIFTLVILIILSLSLSTSQIRHFDNDEYEHMHKAWLMKKKSLPLFSTSTLHMPLVNWIIITVMLIMGESANIVFLMRFLIFCFSLGSICLIYFIITKLYKSRLKGLLAIILVLTNYVWIKKSFEIRPDNIMVFFALLSFWFLIKFHEKGKIQYIFFFLISAILSFLGKQNAAIFYFGLILGHFYFNIFVNKKLNIKNLVVILGIGVLLLSLFPVARELLFNNIKHLIPSSHKFWPVKNLIKIFITNPAVFIFFLIQLFLPMKISKKNTIFRYYMISISLTTFVFLFLMNRPWFQEMIVMIIFMSMLGANILGEILIKTKKQIIIFALLGVIIILGLGIYLFSSTLDEDLKTTLSILEISKPSDLVFDSYGKPIFRHHPLDPYFAMYAPRFNVRDRLKQKTPKYLIKDIYYGFTYSKELQKWFEKNYVSTESNENIFIIGKNISLEPKETTTERFYLAGFYFINSNSSILINNETIHKHVYLENEEYNISNLNKERINLVMKLMY